MCDCRQSTNAPWTKTAPRLPPHTLPRTLFAHVVRYKAHSNANANKIYVHYVYAYNQIIYALKGVLRGRVMGSVATYKIQSRLVETWLWKSLGKQQMCQQWKLLKFWTRVWIVNKRFILHQICRSDNTISHQEIYVSTIGYKLYILKYKIQNNFWWHVQNLDCFK